MKEFLKKIVWRSVFFLRNILDPLFNFQEVAVLCYHSISYSKIDTAVSADEFELQLSLLAERGHQFVSLKEVVEWAKGQGKLPRKAVALTFDDGYADFETGALPVLEKYNAPATVFVVGDEEASRPKLGNDIPLLSAEGLERVRAQPLVSVGYHSMSHKNLAKISTQEIDWECLPHFGAKYFAYPGGNHSPQAAAAVRAAGYEAAFTIRPVLVRKGMDPYLLPRSVVTKDMGPREVVMHASRAADWYYALTH